MFADTALWVKAFSLCLHLRRFIRMAVTRMTFAVSGGCCLARAKGAVAAGSMARVGEAWKPALRGQPNFVPNHLRPSRKARGKGVQPPGAGVWLGCHRLPPSPRRRWPRGASRQAEVAGAH